MPIADFPGCPQLGLRRRSAVRTGFRLRHTGGTQGADLRGPPEGADGPAGRGL
ncbi:MAG: hypothetical protein MZV70_29625 [Desulfobacterales bacterium]|nr:hypothetical protein [Desulfobacterales bacterium]